MNFHLFKQLTLVTLALFGLSHFAIAQEDNFTPPSLSTSDSNYKLRANDSISVVVFRIPEVGIQQRIDGKGKINIPLLGIEHVAGMTVREVEEYLRNRFIQEELLVDPQVIVSVTGYSGRFFHILGEVNSPGIKSFPNNQSSLDIKEVISMAGGFGDLAQKKSVRVTRRDEAGNENSFTINLTKLMEGKADRSTEEMKTLLVYPGDIIFVPERLF